MINTNFIITLLLLLVIIYFVEKKESFESKATETTGLYNYFFQEFMNPYPLPLNKFFSNDIQGNPSS